MTARTPPHEHDGDEVSGLARLIKIFKRQIIDLAHIDDTAIHDDVAGEINAIASKATPVSADIVVIEDSAASFAKKKATLGTLAVTDTGAIHKATAAEISALTQKTTPVAADHLLIEDSAAANVKKRITAGSLFPAVFPAGYLVGSPIYYTTPGADTFMKANYPGLRAVIVECVGGGGSGGSCATTSAGQAAVGAGGGGGAYARSFVLVDDLDTSEAVTVGAGGNAPSAGNNNGNAGADSVFDTISGEVRADAGEGGAGADSGTGGFIYEGAGGIAGGSVGDIVIVGGAGGRGANTASTIVNFGEGGSSHFAPVSRDWTNSAVASAGAAGRLYGGGGAGAYAAGSSGTQQAGGAGGQGIVIVTPLY